jgi:hypothetical protein
MITVARRHGTQARNPRALRLKAWSKEQDWRYCERPLRPDMFRWLAANAAVHPNSTKVKESIESITGTKWIPTKCWSEQNAEDFGLTCFVGSVTNPAGTTQATYRGTFSEEWPEMHHPNGAAAQKSSDHTAQFLDVPTGRTISPTFYEPFIPQQFNGTIKSGSATITGVTEFSGIAKGAALKLSGSTVTLTIGTETTTYSKNETCLAEEVEFYAFEGLTTETLTSLEMYIKEAAAGFTSLTLGIYENNIAKPGKLLGQTVYTGKPAEKSWIGGGGMSVPIVKGTKYWLALLVQGGSLFFETGGAVKLLSYYIEKTGTSTTLKEEYVLTKTVAANEHAAIRGLASTGISAGTTVSSFNVGAETVTMSAPAGSTEGPVKISCELTTEAQAVEAHWYNVTSGSDFYGGCGYSANSKEKTTHIPFPPETVLDKARSAGGTIYEAGNTSSARIFVEALMIRFVELQRAEVSWRTAIEHPLAWIIPFKGMAPRTTTKYGEGLSLNEGGEGETGPHYPVAPTDGRLPYIFPAHQGEEATNASANNYAPPNGAWFRLAMTEKEVSEMTAPNWVKAIFWALSKYGAFLVDVGGAEGIWLRFESVWDYAYRNDKYAQEWLEKNAETGGEEYLQTVITGKEWTLNLFGRGGAQKTLFWEKMTILTPPPKPLSLTS